MLKGKKKALAAQVLLGLMVAGNAYTVDCGVVSAADIDGKNIVFEKNDDNIEVTSGDVALGGEDAAADEYCLLKTEGAVKNSTIKLSTNTGVAGWHNLVVAKATEDVTGNDISILDGAGNGWNKGVYIADAGGTVSNNTVTIENTAAFKGNSFIAMSSENGTVGDDNKIVLQGTTFSEASGNLDIYAGKFGDNSTGEIEFSGNVANGMILGLYGKNISLKSANLKAEKISAGNKVSIEADGAVVGSLDTGTLSISSGKNAVVGDLTATKVEGSGAGLTINGASNVSGDVKIDTLKLNNQLSVGSLSECNKIDISGYHGDGDALLLSGGNTLPEDVTLVGASAPVVDNVSSALFVKETSVKIKADRTGVSALSSITGVREQSKSLVETQMASMALANGSADLVASAGYTNAAQAVQDAKDSGDSGRSMVPYVAANYGSMRQESGSHVDVKGSNFNIGFAKEVKNGSGKLLFGPMFEYGRGNYDSYLDDGTTGSGTAQNYGIGMMARQTNDNGFYYEGSVRYGKVTSDYSSSNVWAGHDVSYDNSAKYWGAHVGVGKLQKLGGDNAIDLYGKLFYTNQGSSSVNINGDTLDFSSVKSKRSRIGFRYIHGTSDVRSVYAGLAWQYEFDGAAHATANGFSTPSPSVKGSSGMLELGVLIAPKASPVSFDLGVSGWAGKQKGYSLNANMLWSF